jgi:predicted pyridoxine 5'-phosphate oxidase superfamily flavin-nucleotide-binding protein
MGSHAFSSDIAFTPSVKAIQERKDAQTAHQRFEERGGFRTEIWPDLKSFIEAQISVYLATVNTEGQPYIQHRGGPPGFLHVLDEKTIAFADFSGNRHFVTQGNLADNPKAFLFLMDYEHRRRVKLWGEARVIEDDAELLAKLMPQGYRARPEQVIRFTVTAVDLNCSQHIPQRYEAEDVAMALAVRERRIKALEAEIERLREAKEAAAYGLKA